MFAFSFNQLQSQYLFSNLKYNSVLFQFQSQISSITYDIQQLIFES